MNKYMWVKLLMAEGFLVTGFAIETVDAMLKGRMYWLPMAAAVAWVVNFVVDMAVHSREKRSEDGRSSDV